MSKDLIYVTLISDNVEYIVEYEDAVKLRQKKLIVIPPPDNKALTVDEVFGVDYVPSV